MFSPEEQMIIMWSDGVNTVLVLILLYMSISSQHVYRNFTVLYVSNVSV